MATVYLALGSNLGNREANLRSAVRAFTRLAKVLAASSLYETNAVVPDGGKPQPSYLNAVVAIETGLEVLPLRRFLAGIEHEIGRRESTARWAARPIDIDVLLYDDAVTDSREITVPHPRMAERPFVLVPLAEIAAEMVHPVLGQTVAALAKALGSGGVTKVSERGWDGVAGASWGRVRI